jgi:hypothetical protein
LPVERSGTNQVFDVEASRIELADSECDSSQAESGDEREGQIQEVVRRLRNAPDYSKLIRVKSFTSAEKGFARGMEAADFLAWHWNKHVIDRLDKGIGPRKDFAAFANLTEHRGKVKAMFITGEHLDTYIRTMEKAWRDKRDQKTK